MPFGSAMPFWWKRRFMNTPPAAAASIARHAQAARTSAGEAAWIYPLPDTTRAAIREVVALEPGRARLRTPSGELERAVDSVFVMIGSVPPQGLLAACGIAAEHQGAEH